MTFLRVLISCALAMAAVGQQSAQSDESVLRGRRALLIQNSRYDRLPALPANARFTQLADTLGKLGFNVTVKSDVTLGQLDELLTGFVRDIQERSGCLVYYSGYAMQSGQQNFLLPRDFNPASDRPVAVTAYSVDYIVEMLGTKPRLKMIAIDAAWTDALSSRADGPGLAPPAVNDPANATRSLVAVSSLQPAKPGFLFTTALAGALSKPGLTIDGIFTEVQEQVTNLSNGTQVPVAYRSPVAARTYLIAPPPRTPEKIEVVREVERPLRAGDIEYNANRERYVFIPAGKFRMGCVPSTEARCRPEEKPQHDVEITNAFWMGETEVTVVFWERFRNVNRKFEKKGGRANEPVTKVSWEEAQAYCQWAGGRLPTEAEWEYAARAGQADQAFMADPKTARESANFDGTAGSDLFETLAPVAMFDPNPWKLRDMSGNVWEWTQDFFDPGYYSRSPRQNPMGAEAGKYHVVRGGSYFSAGDEHLRLSYRKEQREKANNVGFRCVLPDSPETRKRMQK